MSIVTIVVTTHNREKYLRKCIDSIFAQTFQDFFLIIVSDGNFNETNALIKSYNKKNILLVSNQHTGLPAVSRNIGIKLTKTEYICFCDDDDEWHNEKLSHQISIIQEKELALVSTHIEYIDFNSLIVNKKQGLFSKVYNFILKQNIHFLYIKNYVCLSSIIIRTDIAKEILFNESVEFRGSEDYLFLLNLLHKSNKIFQIPQKYVRYRLHENNLSSNLLKGYKRSIKILFIKLKEEKITVKPIIIASIFIYQLKIAIFRIKIA